MFYGIKRIENFGIIQEIPVDYYEQDKKRLIVEFFKMAIQHLLGYNAFDGNTKVLTLINDNEINELNKKLLIIDIRTFIYRYDNFYNNNDYDKDIFKFKECENFKLIDDVYNELLKNDFLSERLED